MIRISQVLCPHCFTPYDIYMIDSIPTININSITPPKEVFSKVEKIYSWKYYLVKRIESKETLYLRDRTKEHEIIRVLVWDYGLEKYIEWDRYNGRKQVYSTGWLLSLVDRDREDYPIKIVDILGSDNE